MRTSTTCRFVLMSIIFLLGVPLAAHLLFSRLGFNPTDDGFTLAYARRLLEGQVPHRDFIAIRPCLSPLLHAPVVLWGGESTYWISRFLVWLQLAIAAWAGVRVVSRILRTQMDVSAQFWMSLIAFMFTAHYFPIMAWHTIDGLMLGVAGLFLIGSGGSKRRLTGYFLVGATCICKQSFLLLPLGILLLLGDVRSWRCRSAALLPMIGYLLILITTGASQPAVYQLFSQHGFWAHAVLPYWNEVTGLGLLCGVLTGWLFIYRPGFLNHPWPGRLLQGVLLAVFYVCPLLASSLAMATAKLAPAAFGLFGMGCGFVMAAAFGWRQIERQKIIRSGLLVLLLTWSLSVSVGYNSPALGSGMLVLFLLLIPWHCRAPRQRWRREVILVAATIATMTGFWFARQTHIYRESRAPQLTSELDTVLPGGRLLLTNPNTFAFMSDLNGAIEQARERGLEYAILPEVAGHWVQAQQLNPLPIDWTLSTELNHPRLIARVVDELTARRGQLLIIVQRVKTSSLHEGFQPLPKTDSFAVANHVTTHFEKVGATEYFDLYE